MMSEMMKQCCGTDGMPNFEKMKQFMEQCGKTEFNEEHIAMMKEFCAGESMPDFGKMKAMMEKCGCHVPESESEVSQ
jgi:hypothetical protein